MPEEANPKLRAHSPPPPEVTQRVPPQPPYAELVVTSNFSFLRGGSHPDELVYRAAELGYAAVAVADRNTLGGVVRAHVAAKKVGLKLLVGARLVMVDSPDVVVWVPDRAAYGRLCRLLTIGRRRAPKGECTLALSDLLEHAQGLLAAVLPPDPTHADASYPLRLLKDGFGDRLSLAVSCGYAADDTRRLEKFADLAKRHGIPLLATNDVLYHHPSRRPLQDVLTCVREGCTLDEAGFRLLANDERHLKLPERMHRLFADYPQALRRGMWVAEQCAFKMSDLKYEYPDEVTPAGTTPLTHLTDLTLAGAAVRYPDGVPDAVLKQVHLELAFIAKQTIEAYFLTVHDLVQFARGRGILCQGRGSAANSAVCYCLGVTAVDPAKTDLLFDRFLNASRDEPPDIDIDFEHERREEVIQYVYQKYGRDRAGMTATLVQYRGRSAVRDIGKALGLGQDVVEQLAKRLDWWHKGKLTDVQLKEAALDPADRSMRLLVDLIEQILGFPRHLSQHTGGMVISRGPLCELVPIENAAMADRTVIAWEKDDIEDLGIFKVDILALGMLTCLSRGLAMLNARRPTDAAKLELYTLPPDDPATYAMISRADTVGVFQIESRAQMSMLPRLKPKEFYDLVIEVAIVRPGPIQGDMVHPYLRRRDGLEAVEYPKPELKKVLWRTLGVPLFQEQAMKIVMVAANFSGEDANLYRRAMAAWKSGGAVEAFEQRIVAGMKANGYTDEFALKLCNQLRGFGSYGFPESHAASFALLVYASSWMKRHHPAVFACALLNSQPMGFYAPAQVVRDAIEHGVPVRAVDVNHSEYDCTLEDDEAGYEGESDFDLAVTPRRGASRGFFPSVGSGPVEESAARAAASSDPSNRLTKSSTDPSAWGFDGPALRLGLCRVKGLRREHADRVVAARRSGGPFTSIEQFHRASGLPASAVARLAEADAFGSLAITRRPAAWRALALDDTQLPLFADLISESSSDSASGSASEPAVELPPMPLGQEVLADYAVGGLSLKAHPVSLVREELTRRRVTPAAALRTMTRGWVRVAGLVLIRQRPGTAKGIVFMTIEDETGVVNLIVSPEVFDADRPAARHASLLHAEGPLQRQGEVVHVHAKRISDFSDLLADFAVPSRDFH